MIEESYMASYIQDLMQRIGPSFGLQMLMMSSEVASSLIGKVANAKKRKVSKSNDKAHLQENEGFIVII